MRGADGLTRYCSDAEIIKLSLVLYPEKVQQDIREDAQNLLLSMHERTLEQHPYKRPMFGEMSAYELLYALGRWANEEYPE